MAAAAGHPVILESDTRILALRQSWDFSTQDDAGQCAEGEQADDELMTGSAGDCASYPAAFCVLCGEGDFSFARSIVTAHRRAFDSRSGSESLATEPNSQVDVRRGPVFVCTSLDSEDTVLSRYKDAAENLAVIRSCGGIVIHDVDATDSQALCGAVDQAMAQADSDETRGIILFNFPHHCGKGKIHVNRQLLRNFFIAAAQTLRSHDDKTHPARPSEVYVSLAPGQGGTSVDASAQRQWGNSWQVVCRAGEAGLVCRGAFPFLAERWAAMGYSPRGRRSQGNGEFHVWRAVTHVFAPEGHGIHAVCSPVWKHDVGMWCSPDAAPSLEQPGVFSEREFIDFIRSFVGNDLLLDEGDGEAVVLINREKQADLGLPHPQNEFERERARYTHRLTYRIHYCATGDRALSRERAGAMQLALRAAIQKSGLRALVT